jgi:hypothetical protein
MLQKYAFAQLSNAFRTPPERCRNLDFSAGLRVELSSEFTTLGFCPNACLIQRYTLIPHSDAMAASSPASSPRLPSPPPIAEDQIGPTSPGVSLFEDHGQFPSINSIDTGAARRIRPGTKSEDMAEGPPLVELAEVCHHDIGLN